MSAGDDPLSPTLSDREFEFLRDLARRETGIALSEAKRQLVCNRLRRRLQALGLPGLAEYCARLEAGDDAAELEHFRQAITTNVTSFFREPDQFEYLEATALPERLAASPRSEPIRIWSAGCSSGEEPYSIALTALRVLPPERSLRILATDINPAVLAAADIGVYEAARIVDVPVETARAGFLRGTGSNAGMVRVRPHLRAMLEIARVNLIEDWPPETSYDAIFCRNVVIYFDEAMRDSVLGRLAERVAPGGFLFLGHSELVRQPGERLALVARSVYRRVA